MVNTGLESDYIPIYLYGICRVIELFSSEHITVNLTIYYSADDLMLTLVWQLSLFSSKFTSTYSIHQQTLHKLLRNISLKGTTDLDTHRAVEWDFTEYFNCCPDTDR